ncbi:DNA topology modulation protein FlaR [Chungangia koreensis]|uniref:DNA topology modulation protein FlaR n=1 Tax=Chungangia koreensis TaxID=752657 RepID=A0ABV8X9Y4_9LACT
MKIYVLGSVGSGKTTLARQLSAKLGIPHYETDNFVWSRHPEGDIRNSIEVRDSLFLQAIHSSSWIIEGVHIDWNEEGFKQADIIVFLDLPLHIRRRQFILRYFRQITGREQANYRPSFAMLKKMFVWNRYFEETMRPMLLGMLTPYKEKVIRITNKADLQSYIGGKVND